jgi:hypothetical protein
MKKAYGRDMRVGHRKINRRKLSLNERAILGEITNGDMLVGFLFSCHSISRMYRIASKRARERVRGRQRAKETLERLRKKGMLELLEELDTDSKSKLVRVRITQIGKDELQLCTIKHSPPKTWDGLWRLVTFDIPNTNDQLRQEVRILLQTVGYLQVQKSVYVYPYDVPALSHLLAEKKFLASQLIRCVVSELADGSTIQKYFKLEK